MLCRLVRPLFALVLLLPGAARADEVGEMLKDLRRVGSNGAGAVKARAAWDQLVKQGPAVLPRILEAMDTSDPVVVNWLRLAFDDIVVAEQKAGGKRIDVDAALSFARDPKRHGRARRLALGLVERLRPGTREKLLPGWIDDPEFREDAIDRLLQQEKPVAELRRAFDASRDLGQARTLADRLQARGVKVSVAEHMGFLGEWYVIGPLDGKGTGFKTAYPPERKVDLSAVLDGKDGKKLRWQRLTVPGSKGGRVPILVDLRKPLGDANDAVAYAWTALRCPTAREVEMRGAADDNFTVWVNGTRVFGLEEVQNGVRLDRHRFKVKLRVGVNTILVKVCQVPYDPDNYTPNWEFLLRITDATGRGLTFPTALGAR